MQVQRSSARHRWSVMVIVMTIAAMVAVLLPPSASAQVAPQHELFFAVDFDGTPAFSAADTADDGLGAHTPGLDLNANNNVLRTNDQIQYAMSWNVNEADATGVTIRTSLPPNMEWLPDATTVFGAPGGCTDDGTSTINTPNVGDLVCVIAGAQIEGSNGTIHPRALLNGELDGVVLSLTGTIESNEQPVPADSNTIETTVSAVPAGDWIKGKAFKDADGNILFYEPNEEYFNIPDENGVDGQLFIWSLRLMPFGGLKGAEPINDAVPIQFFDHFFDTVPGARLATPAQMPANNLGVPRVPCGGYDGDGAYPYGQTLGSANATPANQTNIGLWACTDLGAPNGYPQIQIDITAQDTANIAAKNADLGPNGSVLASGQIAFWAPRAELINKPGAPRIFANAISGTDTAVPVGTAEVDPIQIAGTNGPVDESTADSSSGAAAGLSNDSTYVYGTTPPAQPGRAFRHNIRYANGPFQEMQFEDFTGKTYQWYDTNTIPRGGTGRYVTNGLTADGGIGRQWDASGQTPRGNVLSVMYNMSTATASANPPVVHNEPVHACVQIDTTHQEVVGLPGSYPITVRGPFAGSGPAQTLRIDRNVVGGITGTPSSPVANLIAGKQGHTVSAQSYYYLYGGVVVDRGELDYRIEVGTGTNPGNFSTLNGLSCNETDATWVDAATGDLSGFITGNTTDGTPIYGGITHMRVITSGDVPWAGNVRGNGSYGSAMNLNFQVRVKDDPTPGAQEADQELIIYGARASGVWDGTGQPPTPTCTNDLRWDQEAAGSGVNPATGWCNLPLLDDGASSVDVNDSFNDYDLRAAENIYNNFVRGAHADKVYIVEAALAVSKKNLGGAAEIVANGNVVEFEITPQVVGSALDEIDAITLTDTLPATMAFQGFTSQPPDGTCTYAGGSSAVDPVDPTQTITVGGTITCVYGDDRAGGWGLLGEGVFTFEAMIVGASADSALKNTATVRGNDGNTGAPKVPASSSASVFTGAPFDESVIVKAIDTGVGDCTEYPAAPVDALVLDPRPADWADRCEMIVFETAPAGGTSTMGYTLEMANQGNTPLTGVRFVDVLPHIADEMETFSNTGADGIPVPTMGDGRSPETDTAGDLSFVSLTGDVTTVYVSADDPLTISRDPDRAILDSTFCTGINGTVVAGSAPGACPTDAAAVTAVYGVMDDIAVGDKITATLTLETVDHECDDIWTNTFGARVAQIGLPIRSNDVSIMVDCVFDLALTKVPAPTWAPGGDWVTPGVSTVDFVIELENQGDPVNNFEITDYVDPAMFTFAIGDNPAGTTASGLPYSWDASGANPVVTINDPAEPASNPDSTVFGNGDTIQIPVTLTVSPSYVVAGDLSNKAELSYFDNDADTANGSSATGEVTDVDSVPDGTDGDALIDDETGLTAATGDEDDHDIAIIPVYDLAIDKSNPTITQIDGVWVATFDVTVTNQSNATVTSVEVLETPPDGLTYTSSDSAAVTATAGAAAVVVTDTDPTYTVDTLAVGDEVTFTITYEVTDLTAGPYTNSVQINSFDDADGEEAVDADSTPGDDDDHTSANEDDDDVETVSLPFDLALTKKPVTNDPAFPDLIGGIQNGDKILFHVEVFNQLATVEDFDVIDYLTFGWEFNLADQVSPLFTQPGSLGGPVLPFTWDASGADPVAQVDGVLPGGQSVIIPIVLTADIPNTPPMVLRNVAEIIRFDDDGDPTNGDSSDGTIEDYDSTPDGDMDNDPLVDDEFNDDGTTDEDDHDEAFTTWYDVALDKQIFDGTDCVEGPLAITAATATVAYCLTVTNQGPTDLFDIGFTDTPPAGLVFDSTTLLPAGITDNADGSYVITQLAPGDSVTVQVTYTVDVAAMTSGSLDNVAEVTAMFDDDGDPAVDADSYTDDTPDGDAPTEDDEDLQTVTIPFDLALTKTFGTIDGEVVTMFITVTNQSIGVEEIEVTDYIDPTMWETFSAGLNPPGPSTGSSAAAFGFFWDTTDPDNPVATVSPVVAGDKLLINETVVVPIVLTINPDFDGNVLDNHAEISNFDDDGDDTNGDAADGTLTDADSTPDGEDGNGAGETFNSEDDDIDGDGTAGGDEDDYDGVLVPIFDMALTKTLDPSVVQPIEPGDEVTFLITLTNQGTTWITDPTAIDYVDQTFFGPFDPSMGANMAGTTTGDASLPYSWAPGTVTTDGALTVTGTFGPGETITVPVTLRVSLAPSTTSLTNTAEITGGTATDPDGNEITDGNGDALEDRDSTPDETNDDPLVDDDIDNTDGDEDDHDIAEIFLAIPGIDIEKFTNGEQSDDALGEQITAGETVTWTYEVENTGSTALLGAVVTDSDPAVTVVCAPATDNVIALLLPGQKVTCEATGEAGVGPYENTANVDGTPALPSDPDADLSDPDSWSTDPADYDETGQDNPEDADQSHYFGTDGGLVLEKATNLIDADTAPGVQLSVGDAVVWTYVVTNTSPAAMLNVAVTDSDIGSAIDCGDGTNVVAILPPGATVTCTSIDPVEAVAGSYRNESNVTGTGALPTDPAVAEGDPADWPTDPAAYTDLDQPDFTDDDPSNYFAFEGELELEKFTNLANSDEAPGEPILAGDDVEWTYVVKNGSNADMINVTVADSDPALSVDCGDGSNLIPVLAIGEAIACTANGTATGGAYQNDSTATGTPAILDPTNPDADPTDPDSYLPAAEDTSAEDPSNYYGAEPSIDVEKSTNGDDADNTLGPVLAPGAPVTWTYTVTNNGNMPLTAVTVSDDDPAVTVNCGDGTGTIALLIPGQEAVCEATGTAQVGTYENTATVTGTPAMPTNPAPDCCDPDDPDSWPTSADDYTDSALDPVDDQDLSHYVASDGAVVIEKSTNSIDADQVPGPTVVPGEPVIWTYEVVNTSTTPLINLVVTDDQGETVNCGDGGSSIALLLPGETQVCEAEGIATAGQYENQGSVTGTPAQADPDDPTAFTPIPGEDPVSDDDMSHYIGATPSLDLEKSTNGQDSDEAPGEKILEGDLVEWNYVVTNTGDITLIDVQVGDDQGVVVDCGDGTPTIAALPVGDSVTCTGNGTAGPTPYANIGTVTGTPGYTDPENPLNFLPVPGATPIDDTDASHYDGIALEFDLALNKVLVSQSGNNQVFRIDVINQGTVSATNMEIVDHLPTLMFLNDPNWTDNEDGTATHMLAGPLAPGETATVEINTRTAGTGDFENLAGIEAATAVHPDTGAPLDLTDIDSTLGDSTSDPVTDNVIDNSSGDEDDSDIATLTIAGTSTGTPTQLGLALPTFNGFPNRGTTSSTPNNPTNNVPPVLALTGTESRHLFQTALLLIVGGSALVLGAKRQRREDELDLD